jgi:hypothetical protein
MENQKTLIQEAGWEILREFADRHPKIKADKNGSLVEQVIYAYDKLKATSNFTKIGTKEGDDFVRTLDFMLTRIEYPYND